MKIKKNHRRDFDTYVRWRATIRESQCDFNPDPFPLIEIGEADPVCCFVEFDSTGRLTAFPSDPQLLKDAVEGKRNLNAHIKMWAEGYWECGSALWLEQELRFEYPWLPDWVWKAIRNQARHQPNHPARLRPNQPNHPARLRPMR